MTFYIPLTNAIFFVKFLSVLNVLNWSQNYTSKNEITWKVSCTNNKWKTAIYMLKDFHKRPSLC